MAKKKSEIDKLSTFFIPDNFVDEGTILGGMFKTRNAVEAGVILGGISYITFKFLPISITAKLCIVILLGIPPAALALFGINDGPLSEFVVDLFKHISQCKDLSYKAINPQPEESTNKKKGDKKK